MKRVLVLTLVMLQLLSIFSLSIAEDMFSISAIEMDTYCDAWRNYLSNEKSEMGMGILNVKSDEDQEVTQIVLHYNLRHDDVDNNIAKLPNTASIYMIFDLLEMNIQFALLDKSLQNDLYNVIFITNEQFFQAKEISTEITQLGIVWRFNIDFDTLLTLFDSENGFTIKINIWESKESTRISELNQPYLYDMVYLLYGALLYSDRTSEHFQDKTLLPIDNVIQESIPTQEVSAYSFQNDYDL